MTQLLIDAGARPGDIPALLEISRRESSWDPSAANPKSSARGLWQFLSATRKNYGIKENADPLTQTKAALRYIGDRYGTPQNALKFHDQKGWY
ncbi:transglycosylase SLT domain-containing protein [Brevibacillus brevis]|uniref:aggregation-promoting factor C-terminal-like domain-containing protein n=1 Tax=Brevibacillus brevis TaxID=1393 RepID=UPI0018FF8471|nr:transglycosylase SLT domain-containing protein [Brevibacillus brevis]